MRILLGLSLIAVAVAGTSLNCLWIDPLPCFGCYGDFQERKEAFIRYMTVKLEGVNQDMRHKREYLQELAVRQTSGKAISFAERKWLEVLAGGYKMPFTLSEEGFWPELLERVDSVPPSLIIAQSAVESAWGTSRFAVEGYNLFGQQCYTPECGIVPGARSQGQNHEVQRFPTVREAVRSYVHNLNTHEAYASFRHLRAAESGRGKPADGTTLAGTLSLYAEVGGSYVGILRTVIADNGLARLDREDKAEGF